MGAVLDDHAASADVADLVALLISDLHAFQILFRRLHRCGKVRIEVPDDGLPVDAAFPDGVEERLQIRGKLPVHDRREVFDHDLVDHLADLRHVQILLLAGDVPAGKDRRDGGRVGAGTADALLLQRADEAGLGVMRRRLSEVLFLPELLQRKHLALRQLQKCGIAGLLLFLIVRVDVHESRKLQGRTGKLENVCAALSADVGGGIDGRAHPACGKTLPDQLIQTELIPLQGGLHLCR